MTSTDISVTINDLVFALPGHATLMDAVAQFGIKPPFAAAVNLQFIPNSRYHQTSLRNADRVDLIAPVTGG